jgi:hypothetical protein
MPPIPISQFRSLATSLPGETPLYLKKDFASSSGSDGHPLVVTTDAHPTSGGIDNAHEQARIKFFEAIRNEYGQALSSLASEHLGGKPLTALAVRTTLELLDGRGGLHWLRNEHLVQEYTTPEYSADERGTGSFSSLINAVKDDLLPRDAPLPPRLVLQSRDTIANKLREASKVPLPSGGFRYVPLDPETARHLTRQAVRETIVQYFNGQAKKAYLANQPLSQVFEQRWELCKKFQATSQSGLVEPRGALGGFLDERQVTTDHFPLKPREAQAALEFLFAKRLDLKVANAPHVLTKDEVAFLLTFMLDQYFEETLEKLDQIDELSLRPSAAQDELIIACIRTPGPIDFGLLSKTSRLITDTIQEMARAPESERLGIALRLGKILRDTLGAAGLDEPHRVNAFFEQAKVLYQAQEGPGAADTILRIANSPELRKARQMLAENVTNSDRDVMLSAMVALEAFTPFSSPGMGASSGPPLPSPSSSSKSMPPRGPVSGVGGLSPSGLPSSSSSSASTSSSSGSLPLPPPPRGSHAKMPGRLGPPPSPFPPPPSPSPSLSSSRLTSSPPPPSPPVKMAPSSPSSSSSDPPPST